MEERALLSGTAAETQCGFDAIEAGFRDRILPFVTRHRSLFPGDEGALRRSYERFGSLVMAYSFSIVDVDDDECAPVMVPVADALNHVTGATNANLFDDEDDEETISMATICDVERGDELINTYGDELGNDTLLVRYGFVDRVPNRFTQARLLQRHILETMSSPGVTLLTSNGFCLDEEVFLRRPSLDDDLLEQLPWDLRTLSLASVLHTTSHIQRLMDDEEPFAPDSGTRGAAFGKLVQCIDRQLAGRTRFPKRDHLPNATLAEALQAEQIAILDAWRTVLVQESQIQQ